MNFQNRLKLCAGLLWEEETSSSKVEAARLIIDDLIRQLPREQLGYFLAEGAINVALGFARLCDGTSPCAGWRWARDGTLVLCDQARHHEPVRECGCPRCEEEQNAGESES